VKTDVLTERGRVLRCDAVLSGTTLLEETLDGSYSQAPTALSKTGLANLIHL
jgi:hypothetical protein